MHKPSMDLDAKFPPWGERMVTGRLRKDSKLGNDKAIAGVARRAWGEVYVRIWLGVQQWTSLNANPNKILAHNFLTRKSKGSGNAWNMQSLKQQIRLCTWPTLLTNIANCTLRQPIAPSDSGVGFKLGSQMVDTEGKWSTLSMALLTLFSQNCMMLPVDWCSWLNDYYVHDVI